MKQYKLTGCQMLSRVPKCTTNLAGREKFLEQVFAWVKTYGGKIFGQMRRMGISVDWDRLAFTMDDNLVVAVQEAFVRLHQDGLIYRENRLVNWCCTLHTAVSDIEVCTQSQCLSVQVCRRVTYMLSNVQLQCGLEWWQAAGNKQSFCSVL